MSPKLAYDIGVRILAIRPTCKTCNPEEGFLEAASGCVVLRHRDHKLTKTKNELFGLHFIHFGFCIVYCASAIYCSAKANL